MTSPGALALLRANLAAHCLISDPVAARPYETDGLTAYRETPWVVALPETVDQVRAVLRICRKYEIPVVTRGAGTGLSGGARPHAQGVLLVLSKLNRILEVDLDSCTATVEPGVTNLAISEAVREHGLYYAPDPSSQIACSIGGNVAENSGGVHCLKYGLTIHNVLGVTVQMLEGETLNLGGKTLDMPGYDLLAVMTGSEGMLGVVTRVVVKLLPQPATKRVMLAAFDSLQDAGNSVGAVIGQGIIPAGMEMMDNLAISAAEDFAHAGYPREAAAILLCELDGTLAQVEAEVARVERVLNAHGASQIRVAETPEDQERLWKGRKSAFPAVGRIAPDYYCMDGTIPRNKIGQVLADISSMSERFGLAVANVFHAGDGNLHPLILYDANKPGEQQRAETFGGKILELCVAVGGTVTGEHGVGVEKLDQMCIQFNQAELEQFHRLKAAFDPPSLMNPGKAVPTLARCSELGGMHVHGGALPHAELERF
ncbi:MAG: FAD-binding protein [Gammaproteobacteria bacterium]|nr:FAD-binding protein [Gammaproteobacteria bacterium]